MTCRFWCWTSFDTDGLLDVEFETAMDTGCLRYVVYQLEVGEEGHEHFQGYLELSRGQRLSYVQGIIPGAHFEPRRGSQAEAIAYCQKEEGRRDGPWTHGTPSDGQGARNDIAAFKSSIDAGAKDEELWDNHPGAYLRYARIVPHIRMLKAPKRSWKTEVIYCYGGAGTGKSFWCNEQAPNAYWKSPSEVWWTDYEGEADVVMDELSANWMPWALFLQVMDAYPLRVPTKGGHANFVAKRVFITSNQKPKDLYGKRDEDGDRKFPLGAFLRRVTKWVVFLPTLEFHGNNFEEVEKLVFEQNGQTELSTAAQAYLA